MEHKKEGAELCWLIYGGQRDSHRLSVPAEPDLVVSPGTPLARLDPEARDVCRRPCSLADGVKQAPANSMKKNEPPAFAGLDFAGGYRWVHQHEDAVRVVYLMRAGR
ncbi:hypothetical protein DHEL01_v200846 [Diaporthe helianthi]|uniref:Uncharacterized protein n=1 Tax=Diaporthe helianthi TaxID=158607 RepID=A0A2P5IE38_DIAHE|nr:hypothetical protein DHEL01_v200846 [Diaporthe helianthi]